MVELLASPISGENETDAGADDREIDAAEWRTEKICKIVTNSGTAILAKLA